MSRTETVDEVTVEFFVLLDNTRLLSEAVLGRTSVEAIAALGRSGPVEGRLRIAYGAEAPVEVNDELTPWIQNLCFDAVVSLSAGQAAHVDYFSSLGSLDLTPEADRVHITGTKIEPLTVPCRPLLQALVACGTRFTAFRQRIRAGAPGPDGAGEYLQRFETRARAALADL